MSLNKSQSFARAVRAEMPFWLESGLVDNARAADLLALYPQVENNNKLVTILSIFGSVLVGLGVLLFVGSNWEHMASLQKLITLVIALIIANYSAWHMKFGAGRAILGNSLFLLGGLIYGAAIWLIAQTYQLDLDWSLGTGLWALGLAPMALITGSVPLVALNNLVLLLWSFSQHNLLAALIGLGISFYFSYRFRTRTGLVLSLLQLGPALIPSYLHTEPGAPQLLSQTLVLNASLFAMFIWHRNRLDLFKNCYLALSVLLLYFTLYLLTFVDSLPLAPIVDPVRFYLTILLSIGGFGFAAKESPEFTPELVGALLTTLVAFGCIWFSTGLLQPTLIKMCANTALFGGTLALMYSGAKRLHSVFAVNMGTVLLAIAIVTRYFDTFFGMLDRSLFFLVGGLMLLLGGYFLDQQRRTIIRGIAHE